MACDAHVEPNEIPKHAPPMKLDTVEKLESHAIDIEVAPFKRDSPREYS